MFSGLDKVYHAHRTLAIISFSLICFHPLCQILRFVPGWRHGLHFLKIELGAITLGIVAFLLFITLFALTLWIKIPYHVWKKTHEFFILVLLLVLFHTIWIDKQIHDSLPLSIWFYCFISLALISYTYTRFLYWKVGPRYNYIIQEIEKKRKIWNIYLETFGKKMKYKPGQFIYISFDNPKIGKESHPFSVSSSPDQKHLRISIKSMGDYTSRLDVLRKEDKALIWGPYGQFHEKYLYQTQKDAVLIAGGIGITPFISMLQFEADHPSKRKTYIFYCVKNAKRAPFHEEIISLSKRSPTIKYIPWYADISGFMQVEDLKNKLGESLLDKLYFLCGPLEMMETFTKQLNKNGVKNKQIIFEDFNLLD
jgi:predicted ferric reductase